jgi:hypothetical protein
MKKIGSLLLLCFLFISCYEFLEENPKGFLTTSDYYKNKAQTDAAVNGLYAGLDDWLAGSFGVAESAAWTLEYITGYCSRPNTPSVYDMQFLNLSGIDTQNEYLSTFWSAGYLPIENCNSVIEIVPTLNFLTEEEINNYMGQAYYLRAHYYFLLVRLFGDIPLKLTSTKDLKNVQIKKTPQREVYEQIVKDLTAAEACELEWTDESGRVNTGAIKSLLAKVYITMAGYPVQAGTEYYQKAYDKAKEVIDSKQYGLFSKYSDLRNIDKENTVEHIFMFQKAAEINESNIHFAMLPLNQRISIVKGNVGGAVRPMPGFYNSYKTGDKRIEEQQYYYTSYPRSGSTQIQTFESPYLYKYWDAEAETSGRSGANVWNIRYADVLLILAEAKTMLDGGSTADQAAIDAWYLVRKRAFASETKPSSISFDDVYKERTWEFCFEFTAWYDIMRTRKIFDYETGRVTDVIGYTSPGRSRAFTENDLLFPIPYLETVNNPLLNE